ncbi:hypothetical protein S83_064199, partial [Arachis hypogaea]
RRLASRQLRNRIPLPRQRRLQLQRSNHHIFRRLRCRLIHLKIGGSSQEEISPGFMSLCVSLILGNNKLGGNFNGGLVLSLSPSIMWRCQTDSEKLLSNPIRWKECWKKALRIIKMWSLIDHREENEEHAFLWLLIMDKKFWLMIWTLSSGCENSEIVFDSVFSMKRFGHHLKLLFSDKKPSQSQTKQLCRGFYQGTKVVSPNQDDFAMISPRIKLRDGRHLAYLERGVSKDVAKYKIIIVHGFGSSKEMNFLAPQELIDELGIYLLQYDRAGYGESDPNPKRSLKSEALDIQELADQLELGPQFYVIGVSMGSYATWSCLQYLPHSSRERRRTTRVTSERD